MSVAEQGFTRRELKALAEAAGVLTAKSGAVLIEVGSNDPDDMILLLGDVELKSRDGSIQKVSGGSESARMPLARLRPRRFQVRALTSVRYLKVSDQMVRAITALNAEPLPGDTGAYEVTELLQGEIDDAQDLFVDFAAAVHRDDIPLPSLPSIATQVRQAVSAECGTRELAGIISGDAAIAIKIVRAANGPLYRADGQTNTVSEAVARLGVTTAQQLVMSFVLKEIFATPVVALKAKMRAVWTHTQAMAVGAFVLSREFCVLQSERALMAGLLHDIGAVALLAYAEKFPRVWADPITLDRVLDALRGEVGSMVLARWGFEPEWVRLVLEVDRWQRSCPGADYCALLQVVHYCHQPSLAPEGAVAPANALAAFGWTDLQAHELLTRALGRVKGAVNLFADN